MKRLAEFRGHRVIENTQHRVLDAQFGEDALRARQNRSATYLALIRRMVSNVPRYNGRLCDSIRRRKRRAASAMIAGYTCFSTGRMRLLHGAITLGRGPALAASAARIGVRLRSVWEACRGC